MSKIENKNTKKGTNPFEASIEIAPDYTSYVKVGDAPWTEEDYKRNDKVMLKLKDR